MAIAGLSVKSGAKGKAASHSDYVARENGYERYLERGEVLEATGHGNMPDWAEHNQSEFWKASDAYERANGSAYREFQISLPRELNSNQRVALVEQFVAQEIGDRHAYQYAIHVPQASDGLTNPHVHLMFSERRLDGIDRDPDQYFKRYNAKEPEKGGARKGYGSQPGAKLTRTERADELKELRDRWEVMVNHSLEQAGVEARVNMKSYADRGLDIQPEPKQLPSAWRGEGKAATLAFREARAAELEIRRDPSVIIERVSSMKTMFTRKDLYRELSKVTDDPALFAEIKAKLDVHPSLVNVELPGIDPTTSSQMFITVEAKETEESMLSLGRAMIKERDFGLSEATVATALSSLPFELSSEQTKAVKNATGHERFNLVSGVAGAGKSTMLSVVREAYESSGYRVSGMALAGKAADELSKSSGIDSRTIASWLYRHKHGEIQLTKKDVVVLDEAGMVHDGTMERVLDAVNKAGAKAILVGDAEQLQPIQAGVPFLALCAEHGATEISQVRRQSVDWQREATQALSTKQGKKAAAAYREAGCEHTGPQANLVPKVVDRYLDKGSDSAIILAHRKVDVAMLNEAVRDERKVRGELSDSISFGDSLELAVGDRVVFTRNDRQVGVMNGQFGEVVSIEQGRVSVQIDDGLNVQFTASEYNDLQHGYASTIHKSQGMTVDRAMMWGSASIDRHLAYVAMSRHRTQLDIYQPDEATRIRSLDECLARSSRSATIESTMETHGLSYKTDDDGRISLRALHPTSSEVDLARAAVNSAREAGRTEFQKQQQIHEQNVEEARAALETHKDNEPSDNIVHLMLKKEANQTRLDWENERPILESALRQAQRTLRDWNQRVERGATEEAAIRNAVSEKTPEAKMVLEANGERIRSQQALREFSELEKTIESNLTKSALGQAQRDLRSLALQIKKNKPDGLFSDRSEAVLAKSERSQEHSKGGLEH